MKSFTAKQLKDEYINFFKQKEHSEIKSASLIPENDSSVLFTIAGMQPLVPYLLGEIHPAGTRIVNSQKCLRTNDIEDVGDDSHLTFFEMLGNWSLGDYFKNESIEYSFEFLTKHLMIPIDKMKLRYLYTCISRIINHQVISKEDVNKLIENNFKISE